MASEAMSKAFVLTAAIILISLHQSSAGSLKEDLTLTLQQKQVLDKFRDIVSSRLPHEYMRQDLYLMRWLRARFWNIQDAEQMLMKNLQWREDNKMDSIHDEDWSDMKLDYPMSLDSRDKEGRPVMYVPLGSMDLRKSFVSGNGNRFERYFWKKLDEAAILVRDLGAKYNNVSQGILLINMAGFNLAQHVCLRCAPVMFNMITVAESYYPGTAEKIIGVNLPSLAEPLVQTGRTLLHPETSKILHVFGSNRRDWQPFLQRYFDNSQLPEELGGTQVSSSNEWNDNETV